MNTINNQETQDFIEILYERSGRTNGLFTGLYQQWARLTLKAARTVELERNFVPGRDTGTSWVSRVFGTVQAPDGQSNSCVDG